MHGLASTKSLSSAVDLRPCMSPQHGKHLRKHPTLPVMQDKALCLVMLSELDASKACRAL